jgi:hypothetical protein
MHVSTFNASDGTMSASEDNNNKNSKMYALFNFMMKKVTQGVKYYAVRFLNFMV